MNWFKYTKPAGQIQVINATSPPRKGKPETYQLCSLRNNTCNRVTSHSAKNNRDETDVNGK